MADQIDEIKNKIDIVSLINEYVPLTKAGRNYRANCPFHAEKTPSFMVSQELQIFKCFGCSESGDAFSFLQKYEGMDFYEALQFLAEKAGVTLKSEFQGKKSFKEKYYNINLAAARFYHFILLKHPLGQKALDYLVKERGLSLETIKKFGLGFAPSGGTTLFSFLKTKHAFAPEDLITAGLVVKRDSRFFDRFGGRVIFPIFDHRGHVIALAGRIMPGAKEELAKYINSPETPVYSKSDVLFGLNFTKRDIKQLKRAVVVEGELDFLSAWQAGVKNIVAIKGTALTQSQATMLSRLVEEVHLALDQDAAGDAAARRGIAIAEGVGLAIKIIKMGRFKDPDDFVKTDPEGFRASVKTPVSVWDFLVELSFAKGDAKTGEGKRKISKELLPVLLAIQDKIVQAHYIEIAARKLGVSDEAILAEMRRQPSAEKKPEAEAVGRETKTRRELLEENLLSLGFRFKPDLLKEKRIAKMMTTNLAQRLLTFFLEFSQKNDKFNPAAFRQFLPAELKTSFADMLLSLEETSDLDKVEKEIANTILEIKTLGLKEDLTIQGKIIKKAEETKDEQKLTKAQETFTELSKKLKALE